MMKEIREWPEYEEPFEAVGKRKRQRTSEAEAEAEAENEDEEELLLAGFTVQEETLMQFMKVLEEEISRPSNNGVSAMYSPPSSSFVTINGNEESCGPSFSDSSSTVMASIDMGGINISYFTGPTKGLFGTFPCGCGPLDLPAATEEEQGWPEIGDVSVFSTVSEEEMMNKGSEFEVGESDEEWLDRVLSGAPFDFVE